MKKFLIGATTLSVLASSAFAADLPARMPVKAEPPAPVMTWTGCYVGAGGGYGMWNQDHTTFVAGAPVTAESTTGGRGWFGTAQFGCDYQFGQNWLVGAFVDGDWGSLRGDLQDVIVGANITGREKQTWGWAAGGRVGYLVYPQLLAFASGGFTQAHFDQVNLSTIAGVPAALYPSHEYDGWFLGTGYEYKLAWFPNLTWKTEYRFSDYGRDTLNRFTPAGAATTVTLDSHKYEQVVRSELVWRFSWWR